MNNYFNLVDSTPNSERQFVRNFTNLKPNDISILFFKDTTVNNINNQLLSRVKEETLKIYGKQYLIEEQKKEYLLIVMRYIYFKFVNYNDTAENEVNMLMDKTVEYVLPTVLNGLQSYFKYIEKLNTNGMIEPLDMPVNTRKSKNTLSSYIL